MSLRPLLKQKWLILPVRQCPSLPRSPWRVRRGGRLSHLWRLSRNLLNVVINQFLNPRFIWQMEWALILHIVVIHLYLHNPSFRTLLKHFPVPPDAESATSTKEATAVCCVRPLVPPITSIMNLSIFDLGRYFGCRSSGSETLSSTSSPLGGNSIAIFGLEFWLQISFWLCYMSKLSFCAMMGASSQNSFGKIWDILKNDCSIRQKHGSNQSYLTSLE